MSEEENAKESAQVRRARRKLHKRMKEESENVTPDTLSKMTASIHRWLERHSEERVNLKERNIAQSKGANRSVAFSDSISQLRKQLLEQSETSLLAGRIQKGFSSDK